jgi:hypothetical protein
MAGPLAPIFGLDPIRQGPEIGAQGGRKINAGVVPADPLRLGLIATRD